MTATDRPADTLSAAKRQLLDTWIRSSGSRTAVSGSAPANATATEAPPRSGGHTAPLSYTQQRLWFLEQIADLGCAYHAPVSLRLRGELDLDALDHALTRIVERHEILRTVFDLSDGEPVQLVRAATEITVERVDLSALSDADPRHALDDAVAVEVARRFDFTTDMLFRAKLFRSAQDEHHLVLVFHHMIADAWSGDLFARELSALYTASVEGRDARLPELPVQFGEYARRQRDSLTDERRTRLSDHWREQLADLPPLELPADRPRPAVFDFAGDTVHFEASVELTERLARFARAEQTSLFTVVLAGFQTLLARYSGQTDIAVGVPVAGRTHAEFENLIGFFADTLVLRTDLSGHPSFRLLLTRVRTTCAQAFAHQSLPFDMVIEELRPPRDLSRNPLFQVLFTWQQDRSPDLRLAGLDVTAIPVPTGAAKFDLQLEMGLSAGRLGGTVDFCTALFERATIERMLDHLTRLLTHAVTTPDRPISQLPLLSDGEHRRVLVEWNDTARTRREDRSVPESIAALAAADPSRTALICADTAIGYGELDDAADRVADRLRRAGVRRGDPVGVCARRSSALVAALLGVWKAGGAYVPLDPTHPVSRQEYIVRDAKLDTVLTEPDLVSRFDTDLTVLPLTDDPGADVPRRTRAAPHPDDLAYVLYTSGSTGAPKGVEISHRSLVGLVTGAAESLGIGPDDTVPLISSVGFDISAAELWMPLIVGARVAIADDDDVRDGALLSGLLRRNNVSVIDATPATWRLLRAAGWGIENVRVGICTGEALPATLGSEVAARVTVLWNLYGPTECTVWACGHRVSSDRSPVPIGRPLAGTRVYVLDSHLQPVPPGVRGEIYIGGGGLARGYRHRVAVTAQRFVADPFGGVGQRLYRTGDLGRWTADGVLEYVGRNDHQVKIRGYRIELEEVESVLRGHPSVDEAAVCVRNEMLVAFVVAVRGASADDDTLRSYLAERLPSFMVPAIFAGLDRLPLNSNRKVDRAALPDAVASPRRDGAEIEPRGRTEELVAAVWRQTLGVEHIGPHDNFFDLGGHSLLAMRAQRELQQRSNRTLSVLQLFQHPTVATLAAYLDAGESAAADPDTGRARRSRDNRRRVRAIRSARQGSPDRRNDDEDR